jgi:hypothetical protein
MARKPAQVPGAAPEQPDEAPEAVDAQPGEADLPNAIDVDANAIQAPVLTRQGWVCPAEKPRENAPR